MKGGMQIMSKSIAYTMYPDNYRKYTTHTGKEADKRFNTWTDYIAGVKPQNLPKKGGVCFEDQQESLLDQAKELLTLNAKRR